MAHHNQSHLSRVCTKKQNKNSLSGRWQSYIFPRPRVRGCLVVLEQERRKESRGKRFVRQNPVDFYCRTWYMNYKSSPSPPPPTHFRIFRLRNFVGPFQSVQPFLAMLKLTTLTTSLFSYAKTDSIEYAPFQPLNSKTDFIDDIPIPSML
jgi:hypothetical protein